MTLCAVKAQMHSFKDRVVTRRFVTTQANKQ